MSDQPVDPLESISQADDLLGRIRRFVAGFVGYFDRDQRRQADKLLRENVAQRYEEQWARISEIQRRLISQGQLDHVDDLEAAAIKLRAFVDRVEGASYGYAGFFDHASINSKELEKIYAYDQALLEAADDLSRAVDQVEASIGGDGLGEAIADLTQRSQGAVDLYNQRREVILTA